MSVDPGPPLSPCERESFVLAAALLLAVFLLHLVPTLLAGFLTSMILHGMARRLQGERVSHGLARALAAGLLGLVAGGVVVAAFILLYGFLRGRFGDFPGILDSVGDALARVQRTLGGRGLNLPQTFPDSSTEGIAAWLREHAVELRHARTAGLRGLVHALFGAVLGVLVFFHVPPEAPGPLAAALGRRLRHFDEAFRTVMKAQIEISALNTLLTAIYLLAILPLIGAHLPLPGTLVALTFVTGLIPVAGNLVSNTVLVLVSLGVSPWVAVSSLVFLVAIHKLEYLLNAKIVGGHIGAAAWETLLAIVVFEAAFGVPGVVLAPAIYAFSKNELREHGLV
ncbi:MAG: AI-2E family transporter [Thermoanaerobaculia bacterium]